MSKIIRRQTPCVKVGSLSLGSQSPIVIQTMTSTPTSDTQATYQQTLDLMEAGAEMVRWTINDEASVLSAIEMIQKLRREKITIPIIGDFHFNGHLLLSRHEILAELLDKYRINPGNVGKEKSNQGPFATMIRLAQKYKKAVRIGVNGGSLDQDLLKKLSIENQKSSLPQSDHKVFLSAMVQSALDSAYQALDLGLTKEHLVLSVKLSNVNDTVDVYEALAKKDDFVLHLGLTEAGSGLKGIISTSSALAVLLQKGIGDTIRVSLTPEPHQPRTQEVKVARHILQSLGFRYFEPEIISCPGCGRTKDTYFQQLAQETQEFVSSHLPLWKQKWPQVVEMKIAVMGCVVNGPGESSHANIGISLPGLSEENRAPVYIDGQKHTLLKGVKLKEEFFHLIAQYIERHYETKS